MPADPALPETVLLDPVLPDTALLDPVLPDTALLDPVLPDTLLLDPALPGPVLTPAPAADEVLSVGLAPVSLEAGVLDVGATAVEELPLAGAVAVTRVMAVLDGWAEVVAQGVPVALAVWLAPVALVLDLAEAVVLSRAVEVALALPVTVLVGVTVTLALSPGLLFVLPLGGLFTDFVADAVGVADLADATAVDDGETDGHTVPCTLLGPAEVPPWLTPPAGTPP